MPFPAYFHSKRAVGRCVGLTTAPEPEPDKDLDSRVRLEIFARINYFAFAGLFLPISPGRWHGQCCLISPLSERWISPAACCCGSHWPCVSLKRLVLTVNPAFDARCRAGDVKTEQGSEALAAFEWRSREKRKSHGGWNGDMQESRRRCRSASLLCSGALC